MKPTIAVTFPCHGAVLPWTTLTLLANVGRLAREGYGVVNVAGQSSIVAKSRNECVRGAQANKADWIFMIDADISGPADIIERLLAHDRDIVGATYRRRGPPFELLGKPLVGDKLEGLTEMSHLPTGCLLIRASVFEALRRPFFRFGVDETSGEVVSEDYTFCTDVRRHGFSVWCDTELSLELKHWGTLPIGAKLDGSE